MLEIKSRHEGIMEKAKIKQTGVLGGGGMEVKRSILTILAASFILFGFCINLSSCKACSKDKDQNQAKDKDANDEPEDKAGDSSSADSVEGDGNVGSNDDILGRDGNAVTDAAKVTENEKIKKDAAKAAEDGKVNIAITNVRNAAKKVVNTALSRQKAEIAAAEYMLSLGCSWPNRGPVVELNWVVDGDANPWVKEVKAWSHTVVALANSADSVLNGSASESEWQSAVGVANSATDKDMNDKWGNVISVLNTSDPRVPKYGWKLCWRVLKEPSRQANPDNAKVVTDANNAATEFGKAKDELTKAKDGLVNAMDEWLKAKKQPL
jgi:hypothetical protein